MSQLIGNLGRTSVAASALLWTIPAMAQSTGQTTVSSQSIEASDPNFFTGLFAPSRSNLLGSIGGLRDLLGKYGIILNITDAETALGDVSGGYQRGATVQGLTTATMQIDTGKAFGISGGTFNVSALQIHGNNTFDASDLGTIQTTNGNEAENATRLWELWYDQSFAEGAFDTKIGQQSIDQEFMVSQYSGDFINTMMGWPALPSNDLYAGGPAYPLSSLGIRLRGRPTPSLTVLAGVFDDDPPGGTFSDDPQSLDAGGYKFSVRNGALMIAEVQYAVNQPSIGQMDYSNGSDSGGSTGLPGTYKLGVWYDTAAFPDQEYDNTGLSLADPDSSGVPGMHQGNYSFYGVMDQMVWRDGPQSPRYIGVFLRAMGAPSPQNFLTFSTNGGLVMGDPLPGRDNDIVGLGFGLAKVSAAVSALDQATIYYTNNSIPIRSTETFLELTYQYQVAPWWTMQPDFQYIFNPGAGIQDPDNLSRRVANEAVFGLRSTVTF